MAEIRPFKGLRYTEKAEDIKELCCPPYDIISEEQRQAYLRENPYNVIRLELPRDGEDPYRQAGATLSSWICEDILKKDNQDAVYIYEEEFLSGGKRKSIKGFICLVKLEEFSKGVVLPHEETLSKAKTDRFNLMKSTHSNFSQIYSLYMDDNGSTYSRLEQLSSRQPDQAFTGEDGVTHRLWIVYDKEQIAAIAADFAHRKLYIADGHHRYETALNFQRYMEEQGNKEGQFDSVMMMLVNMENEGLVVYPTHRIVRGIDNFAASKIIDGAGELFDVEDVSDQQAVNAKLDGLYSDGKSAFALYADRKWWMLTLKDGSVLDRQYPDKSKAFRGLDVTALHALVLERILHIDKENMANQKNLIYTRDLSVALSQVESGEANCAFIMNPTRVEEIRDVALANEKMPQKSTYFYPKLITGLVMNKMD